MNVLLESCLLQAKYPQFLQQVFSNLVPGPLTPFFRVLANIEVFLFKYRTQESTQ